LTAATQDSARSTQFLAVLLVHRKGQEGSLPTVERLSGTGAVGVRLKASDGAEDIIAFRTDPDAAKVAIGGLQLTGRVVAQGKDRAGRVVCGLVHPRAKDRDETR
jgi:hypothetical protein